MVNESRRQLLTNAAKTVPLAALALAGTSGPSVLAAPKGTTATTAILNNLAGAAGTGGFVGALTVNAVQVVNGVLMAVGQLTGNVIDATGAVVGAVDQQISVPLQAAASCEILSLTLGPLDLNLLGLVVHLNQVVLNITAVPGAGNLLGNLLCALVGILDIPGALASITHILDLINNLLSGLTNPGVGGVMWIAPSNGMRLYSA